MLQSRQNALKRNKSTSRGKATLASYTRCQELASPRWFPRGSRVPQAPPERPTPSAFPPRQPAGDFLSLPHYLACEAQQFRMADWTLFAAFETIFPTSMEVFFHGGSPAGSPCGHGSCPQRCQQRAGGGHQEQEWGLFSWLMICCLQCCNTQSQLYLITPQVAWLL